MKLLLLGGTRFVDRDLDLPLWIPEEKSGFDSIDSGKARAEGLTFRPLAETILDTLAWIKAHPDSRSPG